MPPLTVGVLQVTLGEMKFHFPCHGNAQCFYKGNRGSISSVIQSTTSRLSTNTSGSGGTNPGSIDSSHTYFVFVMGEMSISTAVEDEVEAFLRGGVEQGFRSEHFRKWMDGNSTLHRKEDRSQAKVLSPSKVRMEFSMEAYLTDVRSFRALNSIPVLKVLDPVNVAVQLWSTWGMGNAGPHQDLQVCLRLVIQVLWKPFLVHISCSVCVSGASIAMMLSLKIASPLATLVVIGS